MTFHLISVLCKKRLEQKQNIKEIAQNNHLWKFCKRINKMVNCSRKHVLMRLEIHSEHAFGSFKFSPNIDHFPLQ